MTADSLTQLMQTTTTQLVYALAACAAVGAIWAALVSLLGNTK